MATHVNSKPALTVMHVHVLSCSCYYCSIASLTAGDTKIVETFLVQSIRYLVTNKSKADIERATSDAKTPSGLSPHTPSTT